MFFLALGTIGFVFLAALVYVLLVVANWKIFAKAGEAGWKSLIPIYSSYITFKISWNTGMFWVALILSIAAGIMNSNESDTIMYIGGACALIALVILVIDMYKLAKAFGHGVGYTLGLLFLPNVFTLILGFGGDRYHGPQ